MSLPARLLRLLSRRARRWEPSTAAGRGRALGRVAWRLDRRHRRVATRNLARAFPDRPAAWRKRVAIGAFEQLGRTAMELLWSPALQDRAADEMIRVDGMEHVSRALDDGAGVILSSAHFGNWELVGLALARRGLPLRSVARPLDDPDLDRFLTELRTRTGGRIISKDRAVRGCLAALRGGEAVAILTDQNTLRSHAVFVPYFGIPAATTPLVAQLHLRTGAPILPAFAVPREHGYRLVVETPLRSANGASGDRREAVVEITAALTARVEHWARSRPEAWLWMHDRWRTRPATEESSP